MARQIGRVKKAPELVVGNTQVLQDHINLLLNFSQAVIEFAKELAGLFDLGQVVLQRRGRGHNAAKTSASTLRKKGLSSLQQAVLVSLLLKVNFPPSLLLKIQISSFESRNRQAFSNTLTKTAASWIAPDVLFSISLLMRAVIAKISASHQAEGHNFLPVRF